MRSSLSVTDNLTLVKAKIIKKLKETTFPLSDANLAQELGLSKEYLLTALSRLERERKIVCRSKQRSLEIILR